MSIDYSTVWHCLTDIQEKVFEAEQMVNDIELVFEEMLDGPEISDDDIANVLLGIVTLNRIRFRRLHNCIDASFTKVHSTRENPLDRPVKADIDCLMQAAHEESIS